MGKETEPGVVLNRCFRDHVRKSISSGLGGQVTVIPKRVVEGAPNKVEIDEFALNQWEVSIVNVLVYIGRSSNDLTILPFIILLIEDPSSQQTHFFVCLFVVPRRIYSYLRWEATHVPRLLKSFKVQHHWTWVPS